jgi:NitT/TauT family transport system permease protein/taurine transport system permease protein
LEALVDAILNLPRPALTCLSFAIFVAIWWAGTALFPGGDLIPPPGDVAFRAVDMFEHHSLITGIGASMVRVAVGLILGSVSGIILGLLMGRSRLIAALVDPVFQLLRNLSPTAMIPIALVWFGIGESSKYFLIFWGTFFIVAVNTTAGTKSTPQTRIRAAQCLGASEFQIFFTVIMPSALPYIIAGIRLGVASAFMTIIPAELLAAQQGLGAMLQQASLNGQIDRMFVVLIIIAVLGYGTDRLVQYLADRAFRRHTSYQSQQ